MNDAPEYIANSAEITMVTKGDNKFRVLNAAPLVATVLVLGDLLASCRELSLDERSLDEEKTAQMHRDLVVELDERAAAKAAEQARRDARTTEDDTRIAQAAAKRARKAAARGRR